MWVNVGPLSYCANAEASYNFTAKGYNVYLSWVELKYAIKKMGFEFKVNLDFKNNIS